MISDDFIFGRSGRGLLLGDRIAFGRTILEQIYAAILATNPTVFIPLEYAVNPDTGEQILFQDSAATVPVTTIGEPIGGVKWDDVIVATQTTGAARPLWGGVGVGGIFDGVDDTLDTASGPKFLADKSVFASLDADFSVTRSVVSSRFTGTAGWTFRVTSPLDLSTFQNGIGSSVLTSSLSSPNVIGWTFSTSDGHRHYENGVEVGSLGDTTPPNEPSQDYFVIGAYPGGENPYEGTIKSVILWDRSITNEEITKISEAA